MASKNRPPRKQEGQQTPATLPFADLENSAVQQSAALPARDVRTALDDTSPFFQADPSELREFVSLYAREEPNRAKTTLWELIRSGLISLKRCLDAPDETEITWSDPFVEVQFPGEWHRSHQPAHTPDPAGDISSDHSDLADMLIRNSNLFVLQVLTNHVALRTQDENHWLLLPDDLEEALDQVSDDDRESLIEKLYKPVTVDTNGVDIEQWLDGDILPPNPLRTTLEGELLALSKLTFQAGDDDGPAQATIFVQFRTPVLDEIEHRAYFPVVIGLVFPQSPQPPPIATQEQGDRLWDSIITKIDETLDSLDLTPVEAEKASIAPTATTGTWGTEGQQDLRVGPPKTFPLPVGPGLIDRHTHQVIATALHTRGLFRRWSQLPVLEDEIAKAARQTLETEGIEGLRRRKGGVRRRPDGEEEPYLAADARAVKDLMISLGMTTGYRRRDTSTRQLIANGGVREYACRIFQTSRGFVEIGLSWGYLAGPWVDEWHEELTRRVQTHTRELEHLRADAARTLFPEIRQREMAQLQEIVDLASEAITIWKRGHTLMGLIQGAVYHQKSNWVLMPAEAMRMALWDVEGKPVPANWKRDVDAVLASLASVTFTVRGLDGERIKGFGQFLGEVWYEEHPVLVRRPDDQTPEPPQTVPRGTYLLDVQPGFMGCLSVFQSGEVLLDGPANRILFNWAKQLSSDERKVLTGRPSQKGQPAQKAQPYLPFDPARYLAHGAKQLTSTQRALDDCLERELTLNWQRVPERKLKVAENPHGGRERIYTSDDCPLLPKNAEFVVAGGNGYRPGRSYTIGGSTSQKRRGGWLAMVGYFSTAPGSEGRASMVRQFLADLETVVQNYYGGVITGFRANRWLSLEQVRKLPTKDILRVTIKPFLPVDYRERRRQAIRATGIEVHDTSEELQEAQQTLNGPSGQLIRKERKHRKMTQKALAQELGITQAMISQIETGRRPIPAHMITQLEQWIGERD